MTPVQQTVTEAGRGNCFAACVASLLDLPCENVPNFVGDDDKSLGYWFDHANIWLKRRGLALVMIRCDEKETFWVSDGVPFVASIDGPRGVRHAVVMEFRDGVATVIHDPYPGKPRCTGEETRHFAYFLVTAPRR